MTLRGFGRATFGLVAVLSSCGPYGVNYTPIAPPGPVSASPARLTFSAAGLTLPVTVSDPGFRGTYTVSGCAGIVTTAAVTNGTLNVTSVAAGACTLTVGDTFTSTTVSVGVTTLSVPAI